jgi:hypothetical protein
VRITDLRAKLQQGFSDADTYCQDVVHSELGGVTVNQALAMGQEAGDIWRAVLAHNAYDQERKRALDRL